MTCATSFLLLIGMCISGSPAADSQQTGALRAPFETEVDFGDSPATISYRFAAQGDSRLRVLVRARVTDGKASWVLRDPAGRRVLSGHVTRGRGAGDTGEIRAIEGIWELTIRNDHARGSYSVVYREHGDA